MQRGKEEERLGYEEDEFEHPRYYNRAASEEEEDDGLMKADFNDDPRMSTEVTEEPYDEDMQEELDAAVMAIAQDLLKDRSEAIEWRAQTGVEQWWRICEELMDFSNDLPMTASMMDYVSGNAPIVHSGDVKRSQAVMNIVRGRVEVAVGRMEDILFPVRSKNWGYKITPVPEIANMKGNHAPAIGPDGKPIMKDDNTQATMHDIWGELRARAEKAMEGMERVVDDQLTECKFTEEERKMVEKAVSMGTGILKGPYASKKLKRVWIPTKDKSGKEVMILKYQENNRPISTSCDPWNVYPSPDCGDDPQKASHFWEKDTMRPSDVQRLIGLPGYSARQIELVLKETPKRLNVTVDQHGSGYKTRVDQANMGEVYEVWERNGTIRPEYLEILGCPCTATTPVSGRVIFINDHPVKASLHLLDTGDNLYDFFPWSQVDGLPWGAGEPLKIMWAQRIINAAWRQMLDNAGDSSGSNYAIKGLEPADGKWEITGKKLWMWNGEDDLDDIRKAITTFQTTNNQADLQAMLEMALKFVDLMTATPTIFQGEAQEAPDTLGATNIVVDSSNVTYRSKVKLFDDRVTVPHLGRYYDYNMQYNPDPSIKVDLDVDPKGASVLFEKDQMRQMLINIFALKQDPDVNRKTDWDKVIEQLYSSSHLDILKAEGDEQQQQQPQDPNAAAANAQMEIAKLKAESEQQLAQFKAEQAMAELQFKAGEAEKDRQHQQAMKQMELQVKMMEYSEKNKIELSKLKVQLALGAEGMNLQKTLTEKQSIENEKADLRNAENQERADFRSEKKEEKADFRKASIEVSKPPTEPAGKAPAGESYAR